MLHCLLFRCIFHSKRNEELSSELRTRNESRGESLGAQATHRPEVMNVNSDDADEEEEFFDAAEMHRDEDASLPAEDEGEESVDSSNHDDEDHNSVSSSNSATPKTPRQQRHSYLPGPSHPLLNSESVDNLDTSSGSFRRTSGLSDNNLDSSTTATPAAWMSKNKRKTTIELPILELPGVVLFPGCTIPIRLSNRSWIQRLGREIDASRRVGSPEFGQTVQLGILTESDEFVQHATQQPTARSRRIRRVRDSQQARRVSRRSQRERLRERSTSAFMEDGGSSSDEDDEEDDSNNSPRRNVHPFVGRVGTIATITYTHGDAILDERQSRSNNRSTNSRASGGSVWQQHAEDQTELILQAVGTERFHVQAYRDLRSFAEFQVFSLEIFQQDRYPLQYPRSAWTGIQRLLPMNRVGDGKDQDDATGSPSSNPTSKNRKRDVLNPSHKSYVSRQDSLIQQLSMVTPIPLIAYRQVWPWRLAGLMVESIQSHSKQRRRPTSSSSLLASLAELLQDKETAKVIDHPDQFTFWLASNMPLSIQEKLEMLQIPTTVERLRILQEHLQKYIRVSCLICCSSCRVHLSNVNLVFTVGGAEGTTGNYVNEHGFIHQVVTLREIDEQEVFCVGRSSTENSYFPGYSWTITYCRRCGSLLGWKFNWVGLVDDGTVLTRRGVEKNRPDSFFGFMSSSLETMEQ